MVFAFLIAVIGLACLIFWIWMIIEVATREPDNGNTRLVWVIIVVFTQIIGALIYYFVRRPQRIWDQAQSAGRRP